MGKIVLVHNSTQKLNHINDPQQPKGNYDYVRKIKKYIITCVHRIYWTNYLISWLELFLTERERERKKLITAITY